MTLLAAIIAGGHHDHDAGQPGTLDGVGERIRRGGQRRAAAVRQVEHLDVQLGGVVGDPVDAGDHLGDVDGARVVGHLHRHDARPRRHTHEPLGVRGGLRRVGARRGAGDDAGHVGAVAERVDEAGLVDAGLSRQIDDGDDLLRERLDRRDAGVDHGHVHAGPVDAPLPQCAGTDLVDDPIHRTERQVDSRARRYGGSR